MLQSTLAADVGVSRQQVSGWENGHQAPSGENLVSLARRLGVSPDWIVSGGTLGESVVREGAGGAPAGGLEQLAGPDLLTLGDLSRASQYPIEELEDMIAKGELRALFPGTPRVRVAKADWGVFLLAAQSGMNVEEYIATHGEEVAWQNALDYLSRVTGRPHHGPSAETRRQVELDRQGAIAAEESRRSETRDRTG